MSSIFGTSRNKMPTKLGGIRVQTAEYGVCIPVVIGNNRIGTKLIDYVDFNPVAQSSGGGGKGGGSQASSYEYYAAVAMLLCEGPTAGIGNVYDSSGSAELLEYEETFTVAGDHNVAVGESAFFYDSGVTYTAAFSTTSDDYGAGGPVTTTGTQQVSMGKVASGTFPGPGQYCLVNNGSDQYGTYRFNAADYGKTVTIAYTYTPDAAGNQSPVAAQNFSAINGTRPQSPWGYMESRHPERALAYAGRAQVLSSSLDLGSNASIPNYQFEILQGGGVPQVGSDCNFADVLTAILQNPYWGALWAYLGDISTYRAYCQANALNISPVYDSSAALTEVIKNLFDLSNSEAVWANKVLTVVPYGDTTVTGGGATFTPDTQPVLDLDDTCFLLDDGDGDGITITRPDLTDNYNHYFLEFGDRASNYNTNTIEDKDEAAIAQYGYRTGGTITAHAVTELAVAQKIVNTVLRRSAYPLATYTFKLPFWYSWLLPMQIVTITKPKLGMYRVPVRIKVVQEEEDDSVEITAETFPWGTAQPSTYSTQPTAPTGPSGRAYPGNVNSPIFMDANLRLSQSGAPEVWMGLSSPGAQWGGCNVWLSLDGVTYAKVGTQFGKARMGATTATFATGSDPDTANSCAVDLTESVGTLGSGTMADADNLTTLCYVGGELISYQLATLTAANKYTLGTYIRRGVFSSAITSHPTNSPFMRLDDAVFKYQYDPTLIGKTVYWKFTSVNLFDQMEQSLADVVAYPYTIGSSTTSTTAQNMTLDTALETGGATAKVDVFQTGTSVGTDGSATTATGATITLPAQTFTGLACATWFGLNFNLTTSAYVTYTDSGMWLADQSAGLLAIGSLTTPPSASSGVLYPTSFEDDGDTATSDPTAEYSDGGGATVTGTSTWFDDDGG